MNAVGSNTFEMVKWLTELSPEGLFSYSKQTGRLPIHCSLMLEIFRYLLESGIQQRPNNDTSVGGLFHLDKNGLSAIDHVVEIVGERNLFGCINQVLSSYQHNRRDHHIIPVLHHAIRCAPNNVEDIILYCPQFCLGVNFHQTKIRMGIW